MELRCGRGSIILFWRRWLAPGAQQTMNGIWARPFFLFRASDKSSTVRLRRDGTFVVIKFRGILKLFALRLGL